MSVDREQIRRDAEKVLAAEVQHYAPRDAGQAETILALLAELEQAERKRDDWEKVAEQRAMYAHEQAARLHETAHGWEGSDQSAALNYWRSRATDAEAQLAKVPALVEENEAVQRVTAICRRIDPAFEKEGGSTRHWVRDFFLPALEADGLALAAWEKT